MDTDDPAFKARAAHRRATWTMRAYTDLDEMDLDEYRYWRRQPAWKRFAAISELAREAFGPDAGDPHVPRLQRTLVRLERE